MRKFLRSQRLTLAAPLCLADAADSLTPPVVVIPSASPPAGSILNVRAAGPSDEIRNTLSQTSLEAPLDISDVADTAIADITEFLPASNDSPTGHLLRPLSSSERAAAAAIAVNPQDYGLESLSDHLRTVLVQHGRYL